MCQGVFVYAAGTVTVVCASQVRILKAKLQRGHGEYKATWQW